MTQAPAAEETSAAGSTGETTSSTAASNTAEPTSSTAKSRSRKAESTSPMRKLAKTRLRQSRSPIAGLGREGKRALSVLTVVAAMNAAGFVLVAEALARAIAGVFAGDAFDFGFLWVGILGVALRAGATWANRTYSARAVSASKIEIRRGLAQRVLRGRVESTGALGTLGTRGVDDLDEYFTTFLPALVSAAIIPFVLLVRILFADWLSALIVVLTIPLVPLFMILIGFVTRDAVDRAQDSLLRLSGHLVELARGLPVLVGLGRVRDQVGALDRLSDEYRQRTMKTLRTVFMSSLAMELISTISMAVIAVFIGVRLVYGGLDLEIGLLVLILAPDCYAPFRQAGSAYHSAEDGVAALDRVQAATASPSAEPLWEPQRDSAVDNRGAATEEISAATDEHSAATKKQGAATDEDSAVGFVSATSGVAPTPRTVDARNVSVEYAGREPIVQDMSFTAPAGSLTLLDGASGTGKTTLLGVLAGKLGRVSTPTVASASASISISTGEAQAEEQAEATPAADHKAADLGPTVSGSILGIDPQRIAWVPQHPHAFGETVLDELILHANVAGTAVADATESGATVVGATVSDASSAGASTTGASLSDATGSAEIQQRIEDAANRILEELGLTETVTDPKRMAPHALSPGEMRRLAIARAMLRIDAGATTALLDEPTAHLDGHSADLVRAAIARRRGKATIIVASHDPLMQEMCDHRIRVTSQASDAVLNSDHHAVAVTTAPGKGRDLVGVYGAGLGLADPTNHNVSSDTSDTSDTHPGDNVTSIDHAVDDYAVERSLGGEGDGTSETLLGASTPSMPRRPRTNLLQLFRLLKPAGWAFVLGTLLAVLAVIFGITQTSISGWLIVRAAEQPAILLLMVTIVGVRFFGIGRSVLRYLERLQVHDAVFKLAGRLRHRLWDALASTALRFKKLRTGPAALDLLVREVDAIRDEVPRVVLPQLVSAATLLAMLLAAVLWLPEAAAPVLMLIVVALILAPALVRLGDRSLTRDEERVRARLSQRFTALIESGSEIAVHRVESAPLRDLATLEGEALRLSRRSAWVQGAAHALIAGATIAAVLWLTVVAWLPNAVGAATDAKLLAAFALGMLALIEPMTDGVTAVQRWPRLQLLLDSVQQVLGVSVADASNDAVVETGGDASSRTRGEHPGANETSTSPALLLDGVTGQWPEQPEAVFASLNISVDRGQWLTVTGPSGSGKSTLLATVMGHLPPTGGEVRVLGQRILADTAGRIAWCPQESHLFNSTLRGNLVLARPSEERPSDDELEAVLRQVGLGDFLESLADGLDTRIGADGSWLSGGQRQRVAIARTLLTNAPVVLLDEPTAHLDEEAAESLMRDLRSALADRAVVCVTHRLTEQLPSDLELKLPMDQQASGRSSRHTAGHAASHASGEGRAESRVAVARS